MSLYSQTIYAYFPASYDAPSFPWFPREALVLKHPSEDDFRGVKVFPVEFLALEHPIWVHLPKFFLTKLVCQVSDNNSMRLSCTDIFQHNTSYQRHDYLFGSMLRILKLEREKFYQRDGTRRVSRENSFTLKQGWKSIMVDG